MAPGVVRRPPSSASPSPSRRWETLRFAAPLPAHAWSGVRDATRHGPTAQRAALSEITLIPEPSVPGESTLNVDVYTPSPAQRRGAAGSRVGPRGGYVAGSPASPWYDGRSFNRDGVVTVCVSYRLGFDGFGWIEGAPSNQAVPDWLLALEWVQTNIAAFGGDPSRVIARQSAGGGRGPHAAGDGGRPAPLRPGLACPERSATFPRRRRRSGPPRRAGRGGTDTRGFRSVPEDRLLALQRGLSASDDSDDRWLARPPLGGSAVRTVVDEDLLRRPTLESLRLGVGADKELVAGATDDEFPTGLDGTHSDSTACLRRRCWRERGSTLATVGAYLEVHQGSSTSRVVQDLLTDRVFRSVALAAADARSDGRTWLYRFGFVSPTMRAAIHCVDVPFWFDCLDSERHRPDRPAAPAGAGRRDPRRRRGLRDGATPAGGVLPNQGEVMVFGQPSRVVADGYRDVRPLVGG